MLNLRCGKKSWFLIDIYLSFNSFAVIRDIIVYFLLFSKLYILAIIYYNKYELYSNARYILELLIENKLPCTKKYKNQF
jgi:hypothetical protein